MGYGMFSLLFDVFCIIVGTAFIALGVVTNENGKNLRSWFKNKYIGIIAQSGCILSGLMLFAIAVYMHTSTYYTSDIYRTLTYLTFNQVETSELSAENSRPSRNGNIVISLYSAPMMQAPDYFLLKTKIDENENAKVLLRSLSQEQAEMIIPVLQSTAEEAKQTEYLKPNAEYIKDFDSNYEPLELVVKKEAVDADSNTTTLIYRMTNYNDNYFIVKSSTDTNNVTKLTVKPMREKTIAPILEGLNADTLWN